MEKQSQRNLIAHFMHRIGTFGLPSVFACVGLPEGTCPPSSLKRLVSAGDVFLQSTEPEAQVETCNGGGRVQERSQQGAVDGKDAEPVL